MSSLVVASLFAQQNETITDPHDEFYFGKGDKQINLNIGFLNPSNFAFSLFGATGAGDPSPAVNLEFDYGLSESISIGAFTSFYRVDASSLSSIDDVTGLLTDLGLENEIDDLFNDLGIDNILCQTLGISCPEDQTTNIRERINVFSFGAKLMYQRPLINKLDTYASTYVGYSINRRMTITETALNTVSDQLGLNTEIPTFIYFGSVGVRYYVTPFLGIYGEYGTGNVHLLKTGLNYRF